jgi:hypothetical protein
MLGMVDMTGPERAGFVVAGIMEVLFFMISIFGYGSLRDVPLTQF